MDCIRIINLTDCLLLKQIEISDAEEIFETVNSQRIYLRKWLPFIDSIKVIKDEEDFINSVNSVSADNREFIFVIHYNQKFAGLIGFKNTDKLNKKTEIGYWLSEPYQKKGIITKSVKALTDFAFNELGLNRIQIKCAAGNTPSSNIPKRLEYHFEGIEREGEFSSDGIFTDVEVYSLLKREYPGPVSGS
jgi:ribosomal-protein-serine acetyltransferase